MEEEEEKTQWDVCKVCFNNMFLCFSLTLVHCGKGHGFNGTHRKQIKSEWLAWQSCVGGDSAHSNVADLIYGQN